MDYGTPLIYGFVGNEASLLFPVLNAGCSDLNRFHGYLTLPFAAGIGSLALTSTPASAPSSECDGPRQPSPSQQRPIPTDKPCFSARTLEWKNRPCIPGLT